MEYVSPEGATYYRVKPEAKKKISDFYRGKLMLYKDDWSNDVKSIQDSMIDSVRKYGSKLFLLDNMTTIDLGANDDNKWQKQTELVNWLIQFSMKYNVCTILVCHPRKMQDLTENVGLYELSGTANLINLAHRAISLRRIGKKEKAGIPNAKGDGWVKYIDKQYWEVFDKSNDFRGLISSWSIAPCSYLLYQGSIREEIGLVRIKDNLCCLMDGHWAEEYHFLKNDLLTVKVVDLMYKVFDRIGIDPPSVTELLEMCPPNDPAWDVYAKGATIGINQVEKTGTTARVAKYHPTNISELCAFVAAIRPGFASMYKTFESRQPFKYGVKSFDELIQTEEMPNSFVLYQEMEMAALHYAGIPMSECYTAIKNIAKKRVEKVLAYKDTFISGFANAIMRDEGKPEDAAKELAGELWTIIEDSSRYSFNACVSGDTILHECEDYIKSLNISEINLKVKMQNQLDILGYIDIKTGVPEDRRKLIVT